MSFAGYVDVYSTSEVLYDSRPGSSSPIGSIAWDTATQRDFNYDRNTFASSQAAIECTWYHALRDRTNIFGYDGTCPALVPLVTPSGGASTAAGWTYDYNHGVGISFSGVHHWYVYVGAGAIDIKSLYKPAVEWDEKFVAPAGSSGNYVYKAETLRIKELTITVDTYNVGTWSGPTDLTQEFWELPANPPGPQTGWEISDFADPSSLAGTNRATLSGETTYQWSPDPSQYLDGYEWNSIYGGYKDIPFRLVPTDVYGSAPNAGVPDSSDLINYEEIHWAPAVVITVDATVEVYAEWWDIGVYPGPSDEWSAILTADAPPYGSTSWKTEIITISPTSVVERFPIATDHNARMTLYNPIYGFAMVASDSTVHKVQLSRNGTTLLNTASASTFQYGTGRAKGLTGLQDYGSTIVGIGEDYLMVFDPDLNELDYIDGVGSGFIFMQGFAGEMIDFAGYDGVGSQVFTVGADGSTTPLTDFFPASYDPYWIYETRAWAFDEWGVGYVTTLYEVYDEATGDDRLYIQLRAFDRNYNLLPGTSVIDSSYFYGLFPARVMRGRNGPVLVVVQEPYHSVEYGYDPSDIARVVMYPLSTTSATTLGSSIISESMGTSQNIPTGNKYPYIPYHSGYGGGYAHMWGMANGGSYPNNYVTWNLVTADINNSGGNTPLVTADDNSWGVLNSICSLGQFYEEQTIDGGLEDQRRRFWRPRPAW